MIKCSRLGICNLQKRREEAAAGFQPAAAGGDPAIGRFQGPQFRSYDPQERIAAEKLRLALSGCRRQPRWQDTRIQMLEDWHL